MENTAAQSGRPQWLGARGWAWPSRPFIRLALLAALGGCGTAQARETLRWAISDVPMVHEYQGRAPRQPEELGNASGDRLLRYLAGALPDFQHELVDLPLLRLRRQQQQSEEDFCSLLVPRSVERLGFRHYTPLLPALEGLRMHLVLTADTARRLGLGEQALSLQALLERHAELRGHFNAGRSLPPPLQALLAELGPRGPSAVTVPSTGTLLKMLQKGRMDYSFESGAAVQRFNADGGGEPALLAIPLIEAGPAFAVHLSCTRSAKGARQIEAIDAALRRLAEQPQRYRELVWSGPMSEPDQRLLGQFLLERKRKGPQIE